MKGLGFVRMKRNETTWEMVERVRGENYGEVVRVVGRKGGEKRGKFC